MMGRVLRSGDEYAAAVDLIGASVQPLQRAGRVGEAAVRPHRTIAIAGSPSPDWGLAFGYFERAVALFGAIGARPDRARAIHAYANALEAAGREAEIRGKFAEALALFDDMGINPDRVSVDT